MRGGKVTRVLEEMKKPNPQMDPERATEIA
jgi:hypothetical protein